MQKTGNESFREKTWKLINSPFGLWALSTVFVGLIVYFYNDSQLKSEISSNNVATMHKLSTETSHRLKKFRFNLSQQNPSKLNYQNTDLAYMIDGILVDDGSHSPEKPIYIFPEFKDRTMNSLLYQMERMTIDNKQVLSIKESRNILNEIREKLLNMENPPRRNFRISQRISQIVEAQPENLSTRDSLLYVEYKEKEKTFKQGELLEYNNRIQMKLDSLTNMFLNNTFLKTTSSE